MCIKTILRCFRNCWEKCEKFANKKVTAKKSVKNQRFILFYSTNLQKCLANNFFWVDFFQLFSQIWNQRKILRILNTHMPKKNKKNIWGHWVHMQIRKKWLNQLKNFFYKHFWEYYLESFCWWISSSCENHCTILYSPSFTEYLSMLLPLSGTLRNDSSAPGSPVMRYPDSGAGSGFRFYLNKPSQKTTMPSLPLSVS